MITTSNEANLSIVLNPEDGEDFEDDGSLQTTPGMVGEQRLLRKGPVFSEQDPFDFVAFRRFEFEERLRQRSINTKTNASSIPSEIETNSDQLASKLASSELLERTVVNNREVNQRSEYDVQNRPKTNAMPNATNTWSRAKNEFIQEETPLKPKRLHYRTEINNGSTSDQDKCQLSQSSNTSSAAMSKNKNSIHPDNSSLDSFYCKEMCNQTKDGKSSAPRNIEPSNDTSAYPDYDTQSKSSKSRVKLVISSQEHKSEVVSQQKSSTSIVKRNSSRDVHSGTIYANASNVNATKNKYNSINPGMLAQDTSDNKKTTLLDKSCQQTQVSELETETTRTHNAQATIAAKGKGSLSSDQTLLNPTHLAQFNNSANHKESQVVCLDDSDSTIDLLESSSSCNPSNPTTQVSSQKRRRDRKRNRNRAITSNLDVVNLFDTDDVKEALGWSVRRRNRARKHSSGNVPASARRSDEAVIELD